MLDIRLLLNQIHLVDVYSLHVLLFHTNIVEITLCLVSCVGPEAEIWQGHTFKTGPQTDGVSISYHGYKNGPLPCLRLLPVPKVLRMVQGNTLANLLLSKSAQSTLFYHLIRPLLCL